MTLPFNVSGSAPTSPLHTFSGLCGVELRMLQGDSEGELAVTAVRPPGSSLLCLRAPVFGPRRELSVGRCADSLLGCCGWGIEGFCKLGLRFHPSLFIHLSF